MKKLILKNRILFVMFLLMNLHNFIFAQGANPPIPLPQPIPPSPNAASLGKYGELPVSRYTGSAETEIPIYQIDNGDIHLPISFSYHSSGVKVEENSSWVGLDWALNAGGVITRTIQGKPDENGYFNAVQTPNSLLNPQSGTPSNCDQWNAALYVDLVGQSSFGFDSEPDSYYFNFNGQSGKFVFDQNGIPYTVPFQKLKIVKVPNSQEWDITTTDGMIYKFGGTAATEYVDIYGATYTNYGDQPAQKNLALNNSYIPNSWYLFEIDSPSGRKVYFNYADERYAVNSGYSQQFYYLAGTSASNIFNPVNSSSLRDTYGKRLSSITFDNGSINFVATKLREDMASLYGLSTGNYSCYALEKIVLNNQSNVPIKAFVLNTDYFQSSDANQDYRTKRLRLNSITEQSGDGALSKVPYVFTYDNSIALPIKTSSSQDEYGFYNGKNNIDINGHPVLIPTIIQNFFHSVQITSAGGTGGNWSITGGPVRCPDPSQNGCTVTSPNVSTFQFQGADRSSDFNYAKAGILTRVQYPTGGFTSIGYESNDYDLKNYVYQTGSGGMISFATCCDPLNNPVTQSGNQYYVDKTVSPNSIIPSNLYAKNPTVPFNIQFSANLDGYDNKCCKGCSTPYAYFKDVTTNTVLVQISGLSNTTTIGAPTFDPSIQSQISDPKGGVSVYQNGNAIAIRGLQLDPAHTYELYSRAATCEGGSCQEFPGCPNVTHRMEMYASAGFTYLTNTVLQYNDITGGLRVNKTADYLSSNDNSPVIKQYLYRVSSSPSNQISSGVFNDFPNYVDVGQLSINYFAWKYQGILNIGFIPKYDPYITVNNTYTYYSLTSGSKFELGQTKGSFIGYKEVQEIYCPDNTCSTSPIGKKIYKYTSSDDYPDINSGVFGDVLINGSFDQNSPCPAPNSTFYSLQTSVPSQINTYDNVYPYPPKNNYDFKRGLLLSEATYDANNVQKKLVVNYYNAFNDPINSKIIPAVKVITDPLFKPSDPSAKYNAHYYYGRYDIISTWNYKSQEVVTESDNNGNIVANTNYYYDNPVHALMTRTETTNSKGETLQEKNKFVGDESSIANLTASETDAVTKLENNFRYAALLEKEENRNGILMSRTRTGYKDWGNNLLAPETIKLQISNNGMETRINYQNYDNTNGNLLGVTKTSGIPISYLWGYNNQYPVAEIKNATYQDVVNALGQNAVDALNSSPGSDAQVRATLSTIRTSLPSAQITTYTYAPLIGMTSMTDAKGITTYYEYDGLQRLMNIKDKDGNIVKHMDYHYQGQ